jgi:LL-diaminopimelate aminotransferase
MNASASSLPTDTAFSVKSLYSELCANMETYIMFRIAQRVADLTPSLTEKGRKPISMAIGAPTVSPPKALIDYFKQVLDEPGIHTYSVPKGEPYFREAVAQRMKTRFGVDINPNTEVCSLLGSKEGLAAMFRAIITPRLDRKEREIILTPDPGYASYKDAIEVGAGGLCYPIPLTPENNYTPDFNDVMAQLECDGYDSKKVKALILNYPSNPIGAPCGLDYYKDAVAFAKKYGMLIISDVAYSEMVFPGEEKPHSALEVPGAMDIAIEFHSLSKPYAMTGWRIAFAVGNSDAVGILTKIKGTMDSGIFKAIQKAAAFALTSPECDRYIEEVNVIYQKKQALMLEGFRKLGWPMDELNPPKATFYFWLPIPRKYTSSVEFANDILEKSGVVVVPGVAFGEGGEGYFRMSLVNPDDELNEVLRRMNEDGFHY